MSNRRLSFRVEADAPTGKLYATKEMGVTHHKAEARLFYSLHNAERLAMWLRIATGFSFKATEHKPEEVGSN